MKFNLTGCQVEHLLSFLLQENWRDITETSHQASSLCRYLWSKTRRPLALSFMFCAMHLVSFSFCFLIVIIVKLNHKFGKLSFASSSRPDETNEVQIKVSSLFRLQLWFSERLQPTWNNCLHFKFEVALNSYLDKNRFVQDSKVLCVGFSGISRWDCRLQPTNYLFLCPHFYAKIAKKNVKGPL